MKRILFAFSILLTIGTVHCHNKLGKLTLATSKKVDLYKLGRLTKGNGTTKAKDIAWVYIVYHKPVYIHEATDRAIDAVPGAVALVDMEISSSYWWFFIGRGGFTVEGTPLIDKSIAGYRKPLSPYLVAVREEGVTKHYYLEKRVADEFKQLKDGLNREDMLAYLKEHAIR